MNELQYKLIKSSEPYLAHYNHNHDKLGRFARSNGISSVIKSSLRKSPSDLIFSGLLKATSKSDAKKRAGQYAESVAKNEGEMKALLNDKEYQDLHKQWLDAEHKRDKAKFDEIKKKIKNRSDAVLESERNKNKPFSKEELEELEEMERLEKAEMTPKESVSIIKQDLERWNRDAIRDSSFNVQGDPYLYAKREGIPLDMAKVKTMYEKSVSLSKAERKDLVAPFEISTFEKKNNAKNMENAKISDYWESRTLDANYKMEGDSKTRVWKEEKTSTKSGVHLIETHPTTYTYVDIAHPDGGLGISKSRVKALDTFAGSKEVSNALREGRKIGPINASNDQWPTTYTKTNKKQSENDWSPASIKFGFSDKGKPVIISADYYHKNVEQDSHILTVYFDEKHKPHGSNYDG